MPGKYCSGEEKVRIIAWRQEHVPIKTISQRSGRSKPTVMRILAAASGLPPNTVPMHKYGGGRRKKTSNTTDTLLKRELYKNPRLTASELKAMHPDLLGDVSVRTIQHRLQIDLGLPSRIAAKKPLLTEHMKKQRLAFARMYAHWTAEQWRTVMFSDESKFQVFRVGTSTVRRPSSSNRYEQRYTVPTVKHPQSVMVWGAFSGKNGRAGLYFLPKNITMTGDLYIEVLNDHMATMFEVHKCSVFMHDSAPCHKAKKVTAWLQRKKIMVLEWPGNSPDLNPIENCWHQMKMLLSNRKTPNLEVLKGELRKMWCQEMNLEYFRKLSDSMPKRLAIVLKNKGNMTPY